MSGTSVETRERILREINKETEKRDFGGIEIENRETNLVDIENGKNNLCETSF